MVLIISWLVATQRILMNNFEPDIFGLNEYAISLITLFFFYLVYFVVGFIEIFRS